jgi:dissimilatory sulfite reductase (desulfoviridin) alpha/beta subunit
LNETAINEAIKDVRLTKETAQMIWEVISDAAEEVQNATNNMNYNFVSGSTDVQVQNPMNELWKKIKDNKNKWNIGQISISSDQALVMITEGNVVKGYLTCSLDINKQKFKGNFTSMFAISNIQNFVQQRFFKHVAYSR